MLVDDITLQARAAKEASKVLYTSSSAKKNALLKAVNTFLRSEEQEILAANKLDLAAATLNGLSPVLIDRLTLNSKRLKQMMDGVSGVMRLKDPVGNVFGKLKRSDGLVIEKMRVPLGAVGIIYEARPNVTIDAAVLCLKAGNAVILRGGSEALHTNMALAAVIKKALHRVQLPEHCVEIISTNDREAVMAMLKQEQYLDVIIPRGSQQLIKFIQEHSSVPVIAHGEGNCHVFVDRTADLTKAEEIVFNAKVQRPSVCNAAEKLLVHEKIAPKFLPKVVQRLRSADVEIRGDEQACAIIKDAVPVGEQDWRKEYLDLVIAIKIVKDIDDAITHINTYGSHHSDAIVTGTKVRGEKFLREVDSAAVYVNASTRFTDGFEFGLGAEIGISTQKLHARGPMGLEELTCTKFVVHGKGHIRK